MLEELKGVDAIVLGAVGAAPGSKAIPSGLLERGLLLKLRFAFDHAINLRPSKLYPGVPTPLAPRIVEGKTVDFVVVREGTEGLYCGNGGAVRVGTPHELATEVSVNTAYGVERVVRDAYRRAQARRGQLTLLHKHNVLVNAGTLWNRIFTEVGEEFPDVERRYLHIDAAMIAMVVDPSQFDVIVTDNLFGDIVTDLAAAVTGGIGLAASANINPERRVPVDVRARARIGPRHRGSGHRGSHRGHLVDGAPVGPPGPAGAVGTDRRGGQRRHHRAGLREAAHHRDRRPDRGTPLLRLTRRGLRRRGPARSALRSSRPPQRCPTRR